MKRVKWGVLGTAGIAEGQTIPGMLLADNCELYAIAGRSERKAQKFKDTFQFIKMYAGTKEDSDGGYRALLEDPEVEAVYIPLPNELHKEFVIQALNAKKHVLCEKPLAPTSEDIQEMFDTAKKNGVHLMEAFAYLHSPLIQALKDEIDSGVIGDLRYIETEFLTSDYDISNIRMRKETYGGATYDLGCYNTTLILQLVGREPDKVQAMGSFSERGIDKFTSALLEFGDIKASMNCGMVLATEKNYRCDRTLIGGTKGCITTNAKYNECGELSYTVTVDGTSETKTICAKQNYALEVEQLGRCITDGEQPYVSEAFSMANSRTIKRILDAIGY